MTWQISGNYVEACNCDYHYPYVPSVMTKTTHCCCSPVVIWR